VTGVGDGVGIAPGVPLLGALLGPPPITVQAASAIAKPDAKKTLAERLTQHAFAQRCSPSAPWQASSSRAP
jgi:hypothetical protein